MPDRIDLRAADDLRDVVHQAVACLAGGGVVALPTGSGYGLIASALQPPPLGRIAGWLHPPAAGPAPATRGTLLLRGAEELADWVDLDAAAAPARKLPGRAWPGPVVLHLRPRAGGLADRLPPAALRAVADSGWLAVQVPADRMTREILRLSAGPMVLVEVAAADDAGTPGRPIPVADLAGLPDPAMVLDAGDSTRGHRPTVVAIDAAGWSIVRPGVVPERVIEQWAGVIILFVCTGNTCRSPMAEALCKAVIARRVGCAVDDLARHGFVVISAGVAAGDGMPAAANAVEVVRGRGGNLDDHFSQQVTPEMVRHADHILAMTWDHLDALLDEMPEAGHRVRLLDPAGGDIPDPVGLDLPIYQDTARAIERHLEHLLGDLGL